MINLTSQLATNAHVVSAFEQSLANMTSRLHQVRQLKSSLVIALVSSI